MRRRWNPFRSVLAAICIVSLAPAAPLVGLQQTTTQTPTFRAGTNVIPVDVRVVDKHGKPILNLKKDDFTVFEDGAPQIIQNFVEQTLEATSASAGAVLPRASNAPLAAAKGRVILITLGKGRLQGPSQGVDAMIRMVESHLLPQDAVAIMAFNRVTDFTTDRAKTLAVLHRFAEQHEKLDEQLDNYWRAMPEDSANDAAAAKGDGVPRWLQPSVDAVFGSDLGVRELPSVAAPDLEARTEQNRQIRDSAARTAQADDRAKLAADSGAEFPPTLISATDRNLLSLTDLTDLRAQAIFTNQELTRLYMGIAYLRPIDGEKHLLFVTQNGLYLPAMESDQSVAAAANDARVVIDTIQVGGLPTPDALAFASDGPIAAPVRAARPGARGNATVPQSFSQLFDMRAMVRVLQNLSELTGGQASLYDYADHATAKILDATSSGYLLGYSPSNSHLDGGYRRIEVRVNRKDATVLYRHGYFAHADLGPSDYRRTVAYSRVTTAASAVNDLHGIGLTVKDVSLGKTDNGRSALLQIVIDVSHVAFTTANGLHSATLDIAMFCGDDQREPVGETWQQIGMQLNDVDLDRVRREGLPYIVRSRVKASPRYVRVVVYDFNSDRLGSAAAVIK